jgi:hypothetical protein
MLVLVAASPPDPDPDPAPETAEPLPGDPSQPLFEADDPHPELRIGEPAGTGARGVDLLAAVAGMAVLPTHRLESNGADASRHYTVGALSAGGRIEALASSMGPFRGRLDYSFAILGAIEPTQSLGGQQHELQVSLGVPIALGSQLTLTPVLGYAASIYSLDPGYAGAPAEFVSSVTHAAAAGLAAELALWAGRCVLEAELDALAGTTSPRPIDLGRAGLTTGAIVDAGLRVRLVEGLFALARWRFRAQEASFTGASATDPTITRAKLSDVENSVSLGLMFPL